MKLEIKWKYFSNFVCLLLRSCNINIDLISWWIIPFIFLLLFITKYCIADIHSSIIYFIPFYGVVVSKTDGDGVGKTDGVIKGVEERWMGLLQSAVLSLINHFELLNAIPEVTNEEERKREEVGELMGVTIIFISCPPTTLTHHQVLNPSVQDLEVWKSRDAPKMSAIPSIYLSKVSVKFGTSY